MKTRRIKMKKNKSYKLRGGDNQSADIFKNALLSMKGILDDAVGKLKSPEGKVDATKPVEITPQINVNGQGVSSGSQEATALQTTVNGKGVSSVSSRAAAPGATREKESQDNNGTGNVINDEFLEQLAKESNESKESNNSKKKNSNPIKRTRPSSKNITKIFGSKTSAKADVHVNTKPPNLANLTPESTQGNEALSATGASNSVISDQLPTGVPSSQTPAESALEVATLQGSSVSPEQTVKQLPPPPPPRGARSKIFTTPLAASTTKEPNALHPPTASASVDYSNIPTDQNGSYIAPPAASLISNPEGRVHTGSL